MMITGQLIPSDFGSVRQFSNFSAISWRGQVNFQQDNDEVRFVLDQR